VKGSPKGEKAAKQLRVQRDLTGMKTLTRLLGIGLLSAMVIAPVAVLAQDEHRNEQRREAENNRKYQDAKHHDEHAWNSHEDQAYRMWFQERHRKYNDFDRLSERDRQNYWNWRHNHSDAQLKIEIR